MDKLTLAAIILAVAIVSVGATILLYDDTESYKISYELDGGTLDEQVPTKYTPGQYLKIASPDKDDCIFNGWNTAADGSGTSYTNQQLIDAGTFEGGDSLTLYAQWAAASSVKNIYFSKNSAFGSLFGSVLKIYYWGGSSGSSWPGADMTYAYTNEFSEEVWTIAIPADTTGIIFNNGYGTQTVDITGSDIANMKGFYLTGNKDGEGKCTYGTWDVVLP